MPEVRKSLAAALLVAGLVLVAYLWTTLVGQPIGQFYREVAGRALAQQVTQMAMALAALGILVGAGAIVLPLALRPGNWVQKTRNVLPAWLIALAVIGLIFQLANIGTVDGVPEWLADANFTFATAWLGLGLVLALAAVLMATWRSAPDASSVRQASRWLGLAAVPVAVAGLGMLATLVIVSTHAPQAPQFGGSGAPGGGAVGAARPAGAGAPSAQGGTVPSGGTSGAVSGTRGAGPAGGEGAREGGQGAAPGGGPAAMVGRFKVAGGAFVLLSALMMMAAWRTRRVVKELSAALAASEASAKRGSGSPEAARTIVAGAAVTLVALVLAQLVPNPTTNPPATSPVLWDSPQTEALAARMCMDCHSNETKWPWYSHLAPMSWLVTAHVNDARDGTNLSELDKIPATRRPRLAGQLINRIKNGSMPPVDYLLMHPEARLTAEEKQQLMDGIQASLGTGD